MLTNEDKDLSNLNVVANSDDKITDINKIFEIPNKPLKLNITSYISLDIVEDIKNEFKNNCQADCQIRLENFSLYAVECKKS